jgi:hypothetical protein
MIPYNNPSYDLSSLFKGVMSLRKRVEGMKNDVTETYYVLIYYIRAASSYPVLPLLLRFPFLS